MKKNQLNEMMTAIDDAIVMYDKRLQELHDTKAAAQNLPTEIQSLPVHDVYLETYDFQSPELRITLPWIVKNIPIHQTQLEDGGWELTDSSEELQYSKSHRNKYNNPAYPFILILTYKTDIEGASCVINKIGEKKEVKEVITPIFEVTCPDGAGEFGVN